MAPRKKREEKEAKLSRKLTIGERFALLSILPEKGGLATAKLVRDLRDKLLPNPVELKKVNVREDPETGQIVWDGEKDTGKNFSFAGFETKLIVEKLQKLDKEEEVSVQHIPLFEKFVD